MGRRTESCFIRRSCSGRMERCWLGAKGCLSRLMNECLRQQDFLRHNLKEFSHVLNFGFAPISLIAEKVAVVPAVKHGLEEHPDHFGVAELLEAAVGGEDSSAHDAEADASDTFGEKVVFREEGALVETAETPEGFAVEEHEHAGGEGFGEAADALHEVVAGVEEIVEEAAFATGDVGGGEMQATALHAPEGAAEERGFGELDVGVEEENVPGGGEAGSGVAADGGQAAGDDFDLEAVTEAESGFDG